MTTSVFLVRHGAHDELGRVLTGRRAGVPLTALGRAQANAVAGRLACEKVEAVHTSPRERAMETASIIAARLTVPVTIAAELDEIDFGAWSGRGFADLDGDAGWSAWNARRGSARPPGGETMAAVAARAAAYVGGLAAAGGGVVCVSHCDVIRGIVADALGLPLDNLLRFDVDTASLSTLVVGSWGRRLVALNERVPA